MVWELIHEVLTNKTKYSLTRIALGVSLLNIYSTPLMPNLSISSYESKAPSEMTTPHGAEHEKYERLPSNFTARDYLNIASGITYAQAKIEDEFCKEITTRTLHNYQHLVEQNARPDLAHQVRVALAITEEGGHHWLQIQEQNKWTDYETLLYTPLLEPGEVQKYSRESLANRSITELDNEPAQWISTEFLIGRRYFVPTLDHLDDIVLSGGSLGLLLKTKELNKPY